MKGLFSSPHFKFLSAVVGSTARGSKVFRDGYRVGKYRARV